MHSRFTVDGSSVIESRIQSDLQYICASVLSLVDESEITALVLGGGYGRGEGAVYIENGEERTYNDYDFFVVVPFGSRLRRRKIAKALDEVKRIVEPQCGIHVDFGPPMPYSQLPHYAYELMYMEAKYGHKVVYGKEDVFDALPNYDPSKVPLAEGARLLMNRGIGLFLASDVLDKPEPLAKEDHEFVVRNIYKAIMAMGDVALIWSGAYSISYQERLNLLYANQDFLDDMPDLDLVRSWYGDSLAFKLRPDHTVPDNNTVDCWLHEVKSLYESVFLWFEQKRLGNSDMRWSAYQALPRRFAFDGVVQIMGNIYKHSRCMGFPSSTIQHWHIHPRDTILRELPSLLFHGDYNKNEAQNILKLWARCG